MEITNCQSNIIQKGFTISKHSSCAFENEHTLYLHPKKITRMRMPGFPTPRQLWLHRALCCCRAPEDSDGFGQRPPWLLRSQSPGLSPAMGYCKNFPQLPRRSPASHPFLCILSSLACSDLLEGVPGDSGRSSLWRAVRPAPSCLAWTKPTTSPAMGQSSLGQLTPHQTGAAHHLKAAL